MTSYADEIKRSVPNNRLIAMMETMTERYGVRWLFCRPEETGERIVQILTCGEATDG